MGKVTLCANRLTNCVNHFVQEVVQREYYSFEEKNGWEDSLSSLKSLIMSQIHAPLILCPIHVIPRMGQTGISIIIIPLRSMLILSLGYMLWRRLKME